MSEQKDRNRLEKIAEGLWPHENAKWKREMWIKEQMIPDLTPEELEEVHGYLKDLTSLTADLGKDSTDAERKIHGQMSSKIMSKIKEISPEYYESIKIQDE